MTKPTTPTATPRTARALVALLDRKGTLFEGNAPEELVSLCRELETENQRLRGIIARNAMQRLEGEDAARMHVTPQDIRDSLEILHAWRDGDAAHKLAPITESTEHHEK